MESSEPDRMCALRTKRQESLPPALGGTLSPVRFEDENCGIGVISGDCTENEGRFLRNPDCVAEREGFEPPIPFQVCRFSRPEPSTARPPLHLHFYYISRLRRRCLKVVGRREWRDSE